VTTSVFSSEVSKKAKSSGKRVELRLTAWLRAFVVTPYKPARSASKMTFSPRISRMHLSTGRAGINSLAAPLVFAYFIDLSVETHSVVHVTGRVRKDGGCSGHDRRKSIPRGCGRSMRL